MSPAISPFFLFGGRGGWVMVKLEIVTDFVKQICKALGIPEGKVEDYFEVDEDEQGWFYAKKHAKKWLETSEFKAMCALARDLGGEYVKHEQMWKVPSEYVKQQAPAQEAPQTQPSGVTPHSVSMDKSKPPDLPNLKFVPIEAVHVPTFLPTRELISHERLSEIRNSIKKHGLRYAIKVRRANSDYELIDGYLRLKSVEQLGWKGILAEIKTATDQEVLVESLITNKHRIEEDPITIAKKLDILINAFGYTQEKLAEELGVSQSWISNVLRLLKLPKEIQREITLNKVGFRHGLTLLTVNNVESQAQLAKEVIDKSLTIPQLEERIRELQPKPIAVAPSPLEPAGLEPATEARRAVQPEIEHEPTTGFPPLPREPTTAGPPELKPVEIPEPKPEEIDTGFEWECPECHQRFQLIHVSYPDGKTKHKLEAKG